MACTARRLPAADGLPIIERLLLRNEDGRDPFVPLLLWWAVEQHSLPGREQVLRDDHSLSRAVPIEIAERAAPPEEHDDEETHHDRRQAHPGVRARGGGAGRGIE